MALSTSRTLVTKTGISTTQVFDMGGINISGGDFNLGNAIKLGNSSGIITATSFVGSGSGLTGVASTDNIKTSTTANFTGGIQVGGATTLTGQTVVGSGVTLNATGVIATGVITATSFSGSGANLTSIPAGQLTGTVADARISTLTASKLSGALPAIDGSNLTGISAGTALSGSTNNTVTTVTGANAITGEANLKFDGGGTLTIVDTELSESTDNFSINIQSGNNDFYVRSGGTIFAAFKGSAKDLQLTSGNLVIGTSGKGIDFSATSDPSGSSSELLDDYEEGTWTPDARDGSLTYARANYTKIGRMVYLSAYLHSFSDNSTNDSVTIQGLPYAASVTSVAVGSVMYQLVSDANKTTIYLASTGFTFYGGTTGGYDQIRYNELNGSSSFYMQACYFAS